MNPIRIESQVPAEHPALPGHFPGQPIVPGVVLLALVMEQARHRLNFAAGPSQWRRIKFLGPILPEQPFVIELDGNAEAFSFKLESPAGQVLARGQCRHAALA